MELGDEIEQVTPARSCTIVSRLFPGVQRSSVNRLSNASNLMVSFLTSIGKSALNCKAPAFISMSRLRIECFIEKISKWSVETSVIGAQASGGVNPRTPLKCIAIRHEQGHHSVQHHYRRGQHAMRKHRRRTPFGATLQLHASYRGIVAQQQRRQSMQDINVTATAVFRRALQGNYDVANATVT
jgi:hypothetical protein